MPKARARPTQTRTIQRYIGFRVNRYGPAPTIRGVGFHGSGLCPERRSSRRGQAPSTRDATTIQPIPTHRSQWPGISPNPIGHIRWRRTPARIVAKGRTSGGMRTRA